MEGGGGAEGGPCCQVSLPPLSLPLPPTVTAEPRVNRLCHGDLWICATDLLLPTVDGLSCCYIIHAVHSSLTISANIKKFV